MGVGGIGSLGLGLLGAPSIGAVRNGNLAFLNDLGLLSADTGVQGPSLRSPQAGSSTGGGAANRQQVDIHIAFVQPPNTTR